MPGGPDGLLALWAAGQLRWLLADCVGYWRLRRDWPASQAAFQGVSAPFPR